MASPSSFSNIKDLKFVFTLGVPGSHFFGHNGDNTVTLQGLRAAVSIENAGGAMMGTLRAQIFGVTQEDMNTLTSILWQTPSVGKFVAFNTVQVWAIDGQQGTLVYNGIVLNSWGVYTSMPDVYLMVEAQIGYDQLIQSALPTSVQADTTVATVMGQIAKTMGFQFENHGVNITVSKGTYLGNTAMEQARTLMDHHRFWMYIDNTVPNTLVIVPKGNARETQVTALVSPETGMIGYPAFSSTGVNLETLFNPAIVFGGPIYVESSIPKAHGVWTVTSMSHQLTSQMPGGPWMTILNAVSPTLFNPSEVQQ